jgi:hypothetical protein
VSALVIEVLLIILIAVGIAVGGVLIWTLVRLVDTQASVKRLADTLNDDIPPVLAKAELALDALTVELVRADALMDEVDVIVDQMKDVADTVSTTRRAAESVIGDTVGGLATIGNIARRVFAGR